METIVLLPAAGMTSRMWRPQVEALSGSYRVLTPDLPGHGEVSGPFSFDRAVAAVYDELGAAPGPVHLCGISLSATVAVLTSLARPDRVRSLVLSGGIAHPPAALAVQRALAAVMHLRTLAWLLSRQVGAAARGMPAGTREELVAGARADLRAMGRRTYQDCLAALAHTDLRDRLGRVSARTLVLCGGRDKVNLPGSRELAAGIPDAELRVVPGVGHLWNLEDPALFSRTLGEFVEAARG